MPERYEQAILKYLADRQYQPLKPRQLARVMGISEEDYGTFREAVKVLRDTGRVILGAKDSLMLPQIPNTVTGFYRANPRGFGFVVPETPNAHGDLYIPPEGNKGALSGDLVAARVTGKGQRQGRTMYSGEVLEVIRRGNNRFVGTLQHAPGGGWFVMPDGTQLTTPIVIRDVGAAGPTEGSKVVAEITKYPGKGELPSGVIVETLGEKGQLEVETLAVIRAHGLRDQFPQPALDDARDAIEAFDPRHAPGREDLSALTIVTIDPPDARDFDDAISLQQMGKHFVLGVHIADVSHFVVEGRPLDQEARARGTSTYFPRRVVPMLPEVLSNGVCSLQEGEPRFCLSAFITYDAEGNIEHTRFARTIIRSAKRLTYLQAQAAIDRSTGILPVSSMGVPPARGTGVPPMIPSVAAVPAARQAGVSPARTPGTPEQTDALPAHVASLLADMATLARRIEARRRRAGMLHLDLPEVQLVLDDNQRVIDAVPQDDAYTHTMIEMFMVEANEAVAALLDRLDRPFLRRVHPAPDQFGEPQLTSFIRACGHKLPPQPSRKDLQDLLETVRGRPESYAVNLAVLKTFQAAEYSPMRVGHFALASENYCHFTSPIRRYPDLTVHRLVKEYCTGELSNRPPEDVPGLVKLGADTSAAERRSQAAEDELKQVLILQFLEHKVGEDFDGVITGVTNFGIFVQSPRFLVDGLIRMQDLGDDWWEMDAPNGQIRGEHTGKKYRIGDMLTVRIASVDIPRRQLNLVPARQWDPKQQPPKPAPKTPKPNTRAKGKSNHSGRTVKKKRR
jgi:ribonuclease R